MRRLPGKPMAPCFSLPGTGWGEGSGAACVLHSKGQFACR